MKLALLAAAVVVVAAADVDWSQPQVMNVLLVDDKFVPDHLTFHHGTAYRLHLENRGKEMHEFTAPEFLAASVVRDRSVLANEGKEVVIQPGMSVDVYLEPLKAGTFPLTCADHDWDGMVGQIVVD